MINVTVTFDSPATLAAIAELKTLVLALLQQEQRMSQELDALTAQVQANTDAENSAIELLGKLSDLIKANATDPVALQKLASDLAASKDKLAAAIVANTPSAP